MLSLNLCVAALSVLALISHVATQTPLVSPCPRLFAYEPQKEKDRWFGVVTLISESDLSGVWLRLIFDRPSLQLGNWFGEIKTTDNTEYLIKNRNHQLKANMPYALRFYLKFDPADPPPQLVAFRLNAKTVCPEGETTTPPAITGGQLQTSNQLESVTQPNKPPQRPQDPNAGTNTGTNTGSTFVRPGGGWSPASSTDDDDNPISDFDLISRPHLKPTYEASCGTVVNSKQRKKRQTGFYWDFRPQRPDYRYQEDRGHVQRRRNRQNADFQVYHLNGQPASHVAPGTNFYDFIQGVINRFGGGGDGTTVPHRNSYQNGQNFEAVAPIEAQPKPLITYGQATSEGEFPWHAALYHERGADLQYICGASLISRIHVITVAHCVTRRRSATTLNPESLVVYLGKYYLKKWGNPGIQDSQVAMITPHPEYNAQTYANDIAMLKLVNPVTFTDYVRPICLWDEPTDLGTVLNSHGTVVGWGFDHTGKVTEELTQAKMPVVSKETCIYSFPDFFSRFTTSKTYCAGFRNGTSVCNGDSGGGMVFPKTSSPPNRRVWQLRGLVSISVALQNQFRCDSSHYVVFTDVAKYLDWVKAVMQK